jgi:hypothetical protein
MAGVVSNKPRGTSPRARRATLVVLCAAIALLALSLISGSHADAAEPAPDVQAGLDKSAVPAPQPAATAGGQVKRSAKSSKRKRSRKAAARKAAKKAQCGGELPTLYPQALGAERFTMIFRINTLADVNAYMSSDPLTGGLRSRVYDRDIFLINTRFQNTTDYATEQAIATKLRQNFPCNRIFALNGLGTNPLAAGYLGALIDAPEVNGILLDWEKMDWDTARASEPGLPPWIDDFNPMLKQLSARLGILAGSIAAVPSRQGKRIGIVPFARDDWNLGMMSRVVNRQAQTITGPAGRGFQSSQTQKSCQSGAGPGLQSTIKGLFGQYKSSNFKKVKRKKSKGGKPRFRFKKLKPKNLKLNLGVQVSFTATPDPSAPDPVKSVDPAKAAACAAAAVFQKAGAVLFWARPSDMEALFAQPAVCGMRPSPAGIC